MFCCSLLERVRLQNAASIGLEVGFFSVSFAIVAEI
jgi:hypothetical protein